jgi:Uma2 family endonuclease
MNIQPNLRMSKAAFIEWSAGEEERCELVGGRVVMMPRPSLAHGMIIMNLAQLLRAQLDPKQWVVVAEFGADTGPETLRYPDVVVDRAAGSRKRYVANVPILLAEVLSPSSVETDLGDKPVEYMQIPSLLAYIVLSQDEPKAWLHWGPAAKLALGPTLITGEEAVIRIDVLELTLPMTGIYAGFEDD